MRRFIVPAILAILVAGGASAQVTTVDEIRTLVQNRQYPEALQRITAALQLKGQAAKSVDRYQLYMLKAESHLQGRTAPMALEAYTGAVKEATEPQDRMLAAAHEMLVKQSKAYAYQPRTPAGPPRPAPIDILDLESRKKAFAALFADEMAGFEPKLKAARAAKSLPPIAAAIPPLANLEGIELAATGDSAKVTAVRKELTEQAKRTTAEALRALAKRLGEIDKDANTYVPFFQEVMDTRSGIPGRTVRERAYRKRGLSDRQTKELQDINATCDKVPPALSELAAALHTEEKSFDGQTDEAARIRREVDRVLDTDYLRVYKEIPKN